jgi:hypothetical protein
LRLDNEGRPREAEVRLRSFSPRGGHWHDNDGLYKGSSRGRLTWSFHEKSDWKREAIEAPVHSDHIQFYGLPPAIKTVESLVAILAQLPGLDQGIAKEL